jgi:hypothetical protein
MNHITLSTEQLNVVAQAQQPIAVHDEQGQLRGYIAVVISGQELSEAKQVLASREPRFTTDEVMRAIESRGKP